jgi:hypothetical protein
VPEEEYIALASDRFKEVEGRKFKFHQKLFPILQDVVKYSGVNGVPGLHEGLLDRHPQPWFLVQENPSGVPEEEYIAVASDRFKEVEGRKCKFHQKLFPILQDVVKYSGVNGVPGLHEGLLDRHPQPAPPGVNNTAAVADVNPGVGMDTLGPREVVVTPVNPSRVNMAGSVTGSHLVRPMGSRRAKAAAAAARRDVTRYGTPDTTGRRVPAVQEPAGEEVVVVPPPPPPLPQRSEATEIEDNLTIFLGTIFRDGHKKDQFNTR